MKNFPIADLHSDLLSFLRMKEGRTVLDPASRGSYLQLKQGNVYLQTLAIFAHPKKGSVEIGQEQVEIFKRLPYQYPDCFEFLSDFKSIFIPSDSKKISIVAAFENASAFCEIDEPLSQALIRLENFHQELKYILYISLTWDGENRFGGGVGSLIGLKEDGKQLLQWISHKKIAVDLSHTSDFLAHDILNYIDKHSLDIPVIASHSNFRTITGAARNLPDEHAKEIIRRKGLIGLNLFAPFVDKHDYKKLIKHLEHGLTLGSVDNFCFGADFFCDVDFPALKTKYNTTFAFFDELSDASCYPHVLRLFQEALSLSDDNIEKIAFRNVQTFICNLWHKS